MKAPGFTGRGVDASSLKISLIRLLTYLEKKKYTGGAPLQIPKKICTWEYARDFLQVHFFYSHPSYGLFYSTSTGLQSE